MEYLNTYDENGNFLGKEDRAIVHRDALWHNTVHCWLYDSLGNVYFQIRKDEGTFYTTASGHVQADETIKEAFGREIEEEIGLKVDYDKAELVTINKFIMDKEKKDGSIFKDRAFANIYICIFDGNIDDFKFNEEEVLGLVKIDAKEAIELFQNKTSAIKCTKILNINESNIEIEAEITLKDFLVNKGETAITKYGPILNKIIELT